MWLAGREVKAEDRAVKSEIHLELEAPSGIIEAKVPT